MQTDSPASIERLTAVEHRILHEVVADRLRELIIEGALPSGARLNERVLCAQLRVSRTPLREALRMLAGEGMIELLANRGAIVAQLSRADVEHAFELMAALEALNGQLAAQRASAAEIGEICVLHAEMVRAHGRGDLPSYYRVNRDIHQRISRCAGNPLLAASFDRLNCRLHALRFRSNLDREKWDAAVIEHGLIVEALVARDGQRLGDLLRDHLGSKRMVVLAQLDRESAGPAGIVAPLRAGPATDAAAVTGRSGPAGPVTPGSSAHDGRTIGPGDQREVVREMQQ